MAITFVGAETGTVDQSGSVVTVSRPSGYASGDVALAIVCMDDDDPVGLPGGFTEIFQEDFFRDSTLAVGYKVMGASEPASYEFTKDGLESGAAAIAVFRGVNNTSVIDVLPSYNTGDSTTPTAPSTTTTTPNAAVLAVYGHEDGAGTVVSIPSGMTMVVTEGIGITTGAALGAAWLLKGSVGSVGDFEFTAGEEDTWGAISFSLMDENESPPPKTGDGAMAAQRATLSGSGVGFTVLTGDGVLDADRAFVGGTGDNVTTVYADGAMQSATSTLDGDATRVVLAEGSLSSATAEVSSAGVREVRLSAVFVATATAMDGVSERIITGAGSADAARAGMEAKAIRIGDSQGQLEAHPVSLSVASDFKRNASGALLAGAGVVTSASKITWKLSPALVAGSAAVDAGTQIFTGHTATGALHARPAGMTVTMLRGVNSTINLRAESVELYMVTWLRQSQDSNTWQDLEGGHWVAKNS